MTGTGRWAVVNRCSEHFHVLTPPAFSIFGAFTLEIFKIWSAT